MVMRKCVFEKDRSVDALIFILKEKLKFSFQKFKAERNYFGERYIHFLEDNRGPCQMSNYEIIKYFCRLHFRKI